MDQHSEVGMIFRDPNNLKAAQAETLRDANGTNINTYDHGSLTPNLV